MVYFQLQFLKIGNIFRKYLKYAKYLIFPKKCKIFKEYQCCLITLFLLRTPCAPYVRFKVLILEYGMFDYIFSGSVKQVKKRCFGGGIPEEDKRSRARDWHRRRGGPGGLRPGGPRPDGPHSGGPRPGGQRPGLEYLRAQRKHKPMPRHKILHILEQSELVLFLTSLFCGSTIQHYQASQKQVPLVLFENYQVFTV